MRLTVDHLSEMDLIRLLDHEMSAEENADASVHVPAERQLGAGDNVLPLEVGWLVVGGWSRAMVGWEWEKGYDLLD